MDLSARTHASTGAIMASPSPGRRSKKKTRPITVEDLFSSVSAKKAYGSFAPPPSYALTPRSAEACLQTGVDPEDLRIRDLDSFWEPDLDPARQSMRHESYCERRHGLVKMLRRSRNGIMASEEQGRKQKASSSKVRGIWGACVGESVTRAMRRLLFGKDRH